MAVLNREVRPPESHDPPTAYERAMLTALGNDLSDPYPEYGQNALIEAFRAGFDAARLDPKRLAEVMGSMSRGLKAVLPLDEQIRWALDQIARAGR